MQKMLRIVQLFGFLAAGAAMLAPDPSRLVQDWSGATIYPWWAAGYVVVGAVGSIVSIAARDRPSAAMLPTALVVLAAQLAGLGLVAVKHWQPSFGMGGGYAGGVDELVTLAWVLGLGGTVAAACAIAQLAAVRAFPIRPHRREALVLGAVGALVLLALPLGIAEGDPQLQDLTSYGAFVLIYSGPFGLAVAGAAWLPLRLRLTAIATCAAAAAVSALDLITDLSYLKGRPALLATSVLLAAAAALAAHRTTSGTTRRGERQ